MPLRALPMPGLLSLDLRHFATPCPGQTARRGHCACLGADAGAVSKMRFGEGW